MKLQRRKSNRNYIHDWEVGAVINAWKSPNTESKADAETSKGTSPEQQKTSFSMIQNGPKQARLRQVCWLWKLPGAVEYSPGRRQPCPNSSGLCLPPISGPETYTRCLARKSC